jgi:flagellar assembly factor FliW
MKIDTTRFGSVEVETEDLLRFPAGVLGLEHCRDWVLLADEEHDSLGWLQSTTQPEVAFAVVSPRRFLPDYQVRVSRSELTTLELDEPSHAQVLSIVGKNEQGVTLNLKAPVVINLQRRIGKQVITNGDMPIQYPLASRPTPLRKSA